MKWEISLDGTAYCPETHQRLLINDKNHSVLWYTPEHGAEFLKATASFTEARAYIRNLVDKLNAGDTK